MYNLVLAWNSASVENNQSRSDISVSAVRPSYHLISHEEGGETIVNESLELEMARACLGSSFG